jgi:hypothetical protein
MSVGRGASQAGRGPYRVRSLRPLPAQVLWCGSVSIHPGTAYPCTGIVIGLLICLSAPTDDDKVAAIHASRVSLPGTSTSSPLRQILGTLAYPVGKKHRRHPCRLLVLSRPATGLLPF